MLERLGAVQLDTIAVLARSQELVAHARLGAVGRDRIHAAYWGNGRTFEYWSHEACVLPMDVYPWFAFRRRESMGKRERWGVDAATLRQVRKALRDGGPQTATELGGARSAPGWWRWSDAKNAAEWMFATGEAVVTDRRAWKRVYDLADRVVPAFDTTGWIEDRGVFGPTDADCIRELLLRSVRMLGIGTLDDIQDVHRLRRRDGVREHLQSLLDANAIVATTIAGETWYADPVAMRRIPSSAASITTLVSPFDPLVWYRPRLERLFGLRMRIEAYTPKEQRQHGYFAMPVLHQGAFIGLVDPARDGNALVIRNISTSQRDPEGFAIALADAARWVAKERVVVERAPTATLARSIARRANALLSAS